MEIIGYYALGILYLFIAAVYLGYENWNNYGERWYHIMFAAVWPFTFFIGIICFVAEKFCEFIGWGFKLGGKLGQKIEPEEKRNKRLRDRGHLI